MRTALIARHPSVRSWAPPVAWSRRGEAFAGAVAFAAVGTALVWLPFEWIAAAVALVIVVLWPIAGIAGLAFSVPFGGLRAVSLGAGALTLTPLVLAVTALGWLLALLARRRLPRLGGAPMWSLAAFVAALAGAAWRAPDLSAAAFEIARWLELGLAMALVTGLAGDARRVRLLVLAVLLAGAAEAIVGVRLSLARVGPESYAILDGRLHRAYGTFGQPNPFAGYMNMVWPIGAAMSAAGLGLVASARIVRRSSDRGVARAWLPAGGAVTVVCAVGLLLSWSRGAWLAAVVGGGCMSATWLLASVWPRIVRRHLLVLAALLIVASATSLAGGAARLPTAMVDRLHSVAATFTVWGVRDAEVDDAAFATIERVAHWEAAVAMWGDRPWFGQGPGHYSIAYPEYRLPRWADPLGHAHNAYLHILAESGLVGLATYLAFVGACVAVALRSAVLPHTVAEGALGLGLVGVLAALAFHALVDNLYVHDMTVHLGIVVGLTAAARRSG